MESIFRFLHTSDQRLGKSTGIILVAAAVLLALCSIGVYATLLARGDLDDWAFFASCMSGPGQIYASGCEAADTDGDGDLDMRDVAIFQATFGPVEYLVTADSLHFFNNIVSDVWVFVAPEWLNSDDVSLAIEIFGNNAGFHEHGSQVVLVSATTLLAMDQVDALVKVDWTTDTNITHSPEDYTVCVQAMFNGQDFGVSNCTAFGPF